jgi:hypothetical protein
MTAAARAAAVVAVALGLGAGPSARATPAPPADAAPAPAVTPATTTTDARAIDASSRGAPPARAATYPLVLLVQADAVLTATPADAAAGSDDPPGTGARLRRARVGEDFAAGAWRARVLVEATSRDQPLGPVDGGRVAAFGPTRLTEAFGAWRPHRAFQLALGAQRVPFSLSRQVDEADLRLPERAQIVAALAPDYRTGASMTSDLGLLDIRAAFLSADTSIDGHLFTSGALAAVRLGADPIGPMGVTPWRRRVDDPWYGWWRFSAGVSVIYGTLLAPKTLALGGDAQLQVRRFTMTGEYLGEHASDAAARGAWPRQGAVVEPGIVVLRERLEIVLRGAWLREPYGLTANPTDTTDTLAGGAGVTVLAHDARVRLQAAFELRRTVDALLPDSHWAILRATLTL